MATEKRLIDANYLMKAIRERTTGSGDNFDIIMTHLYGIVEAVPTVDAVEVVRCKDCKHTRKKNGHERLMYNENVCICTKEDIWGITKNEPVWDDGFCSCGERKKDNG